MKWYMIMLLWFFLVACNSRLPVRFTDSRSLNTLEIRNPKFKKVLRQYYSEYLSQNYGGVVTVYLKANADSQTFIVSSSYWEDLQENPPGYYTFLGKIPVLFYTGLEKHVVFDSSYLSNLRRDISPFLYGYGGDALEIPPTHNPAIWEVEFVSNDLVKMERLN